VAQQFESLPERERPQRGLAPAASLRRKVAMKNDQERERERAMAVACCEGGGGGNGLRHGAQEGGCGGLELQRGTRQVAVATA
jgi:hypothetical protein